MHSPIWINVALVLMVVVNVLVYVVLAKAIRRVDKRAAFNAYWIDRVERRVSELERKAAGFIPSEEVE